MYLTLDIGEQQLRACNMYLTLPYLHKRERERERLVSIKNPHLHVLTTYLTGNNLRYLGIYTLTYLGNLAFFFSSFLFFLFFSFPIFFRDSPLHVTCTYKVGTSFNIHVGILGTLWFMI